MFDKSKGILLSITATVCLSGCAVTVSNQPVDAKFDTRRAYSFENWIDSRTGTDNSDLIVLSFSGGGSRAAALAASVLSELDTLGLANKIGIISSTSGGSVTAGVYAATGNDGLARFRDVFLKANNTGALASAFVPGFFHGANRSQIFADYIDQKVLKAAFPQRPVTYSDLIRRWPAAPFVVMNATDASTGSTFELTQEYFSHLCSDIGGFRVSEAMAASSSFPFLFTPIPLRNHWDQPQCDAVIESFDEAFQAAWSNRYLNLEAFVKARFFNSLRNTYRKPEDAQVFKLNDPYRRVHYVHLIDGGLSDNLAARALLRAFTPEMLGKLTARGLKRVLLIQVNAKGEAPRPIDKSAAAPSIGELVQTAVFNPLDVTTALSSYISKTYWVNLIKSANDATKTSSDNKLTDITFFPVQVDFDHIEGNPGLMETVKTIGTSWKLQGSELELIEGIGKQLLNAHPCFQSFLLNVGKRKGSVNGCDRIEIGQLAVHSSSAAIAMPAPAPAPAPAPVPVSEKVSFSAEAFFAHASADLLPAGKAALADFVKKALELNLEVIIAVAHTDAAGSHRYNHQLSLRRAESVKTFLTTYGIDPSQIHTEGKGETQPVANNGTADGRARNRRVVVEVVGTRVRH